MAEQGRLGPKWWFESTPWCMTTDEKKEFRRTAIVMIISVLFVGSMLAYLGLNYLYMMRLLPLAN